MQLFLPGGGYPSWKITEIPGGGGSDKYPLEFHRGVGGSKAKMPGGVWIFSGVEIIPKTSLQFKAFGTDRKYFSSIFELN